MNYTPTNWANGKAPAVSAENLNKIETELVNLHNKIDSAVEILNTTDDTTNQNLQIVQEDVTDLKEADIAINKNLQALGDEVEGLKETDNTINQTLQTIQDDVENLKANGGGSTDNSVDITETTETTMPNSCEGRLLFKEIGGVCEQFTTTGKNLLNPTLQTTTSNGVICTNNGDGTYTLNGKSTAKTVFVVFTNNNGAFNGKKVKAVGCPSGGSDASYKGWFTDISVLGANDHGDGATLTPNTNELRYQIEIASGYTCNNLVFKPMISEDLNVTYNDFEPYTGGQPSPNPDYPQEIKKSWLTMAKTHGKNLVEPIMNTMTSTGVTVTNNGDGSFTINGTSTDSVTFRLDQTNSTNDNLKNYKGIYTISVRDKSGNLNPSGITIHLTQDVTYKSYLISDSVETAEIDAQNCFVFIHVKDGLTLNNLVIYPQLEKGMEVTEWEPFSGSSAILSKPIELNGIGDVQDVIVDGKIKRLASVVFDGSDDELWIKSPVSINRYYLALNYIKPNTKNILCTHASVANDSEHEEYNKTFVENNLFVINVDFATLAEWKAHLQVNPMTLVYELATPITEELPLADQVALNSIETFDGTTYLEIDSSLQPEFVAEYGTSKVGGVVLEAKGESQANGENIEVMNRILQDAFIPRETSNHVSDANTCLKSGIYRTYDDTANVKYTNGFLLVFAIDPNTMVVQINMLWDPRYIYIRTYWWGTWHGWYKIATELDLSALETAIVNNI